MMARPRAAEPEDYETVVLDARPDEQLRGVVGGRHKTGDGGIADYFVGRTTGRHYLRVWYAETGTFGWVEIVRRSGARKGDQT